LRTSPEITPPPLLGAREQHSQARAAQGGSSGSSNKAATWLDLHVDSQIFVVDFPKHWR
jgi:hypothetical protein